MDERALIFKNLILGVPVERVCQTFQKSEPEVMRIFQFVLRKIKSYCYQRSRQPTALPIIIAHDVKSAQKHRVTCLSVLPKLNLDKPPQYIDIQSEMITGDNLMEVTRNLGA